MTERDLSGIFLARPEASRAGLTLAVKDLFDTEGLVTTYGSVLFLDHIPASTAESVRRLEASGYANVGKTNLHEFAYGVTSENPHFGAVPNPLAPGRIAGGSSGGSAAALAAGLADAALGSDSGGSIRIPAACCGVVGFKPTYGIVPVDGCFPLAPTFDHVGPMARSVAACTSMMEALAPGFERRDTTPLEDVSVGVAWLDACEPLVRARLEKAVGSFPRRRPADFPQQEGVGPAFMREVADVHRDLYTQNPEAYGADVAAKLDACLAVADSEYEAAVRARDEYRERCLDVMDDLDLLVTPTLGFVAPPASGMEDAETRQALIRFTFSLNALGWPALALPCGSAEDGLPASLQLVGRPHDDGLVLAAGELLEQAFA